MDELVISEYELVPFVMLQVHETEQCSQELARGPWNGRCCCSAAQGIVHMKLQRFSQEAKIE
jgi:hypothetical protein